MPTLQAFWNKLNANERLVGWGALVVLGGWLISLISGGGIGASWSFVAAIIVLAIYWLKYSPNNQITWPAPVQTIVLVVAGLAAIGAVLGLLTLLSFLGFFAGFFIGLLVAIIANAIGSVMMALGAWREYQAMPKVAAPSAPASTPPASSSPPPPPASPPAPPSA
jgi:hypothetical protein